MELYANSMQMKQIDGYTIHTVGVPSLVLMERAALSVAEELMKRIPADSGRILAICGTGNNGADGIAAARILKIWGYRTEVLWIGKEEKATDEWKRQNLIAENVGVPITHVTDTPDLEYININGITAVVDAIFGVGLSREIAGLYREVIDWMNHCPGLKLAVDTPSGVSSDDGKLLGVSFRADITVTFGLKKVGQMLYPGAEYCGELMVSEIGFAPEAVRRAGITLSGITREELPLLLKKRPADSHKGTFGKVLVVAGSENMAGAAYFSALAAMRMGCGLVKIITVEENRQILQTLLPEAIMGTYCPEEFSREDFCQELAWADVIVAGPGIGRGEWVTRILEAILQESQVPVVLDADGLQVLAEHRELYEKLSGRIILTPHLGEMAALTGSTTRQLKDQPLQYARDFAVQHGCICVQKTARTVTACPNGTAYINSSGCSGLATPGSGDVLTGVIAGLLAMGNEPGAAAAMGVWIHGCAGELASIRKGERSVLASDIAEALVEVIKEE